MQETRNNCFVSKKSSTTLHQAVIGKHDCREIRAIRNNYCEFLASYGIIFQSVIKPFFKTPVFGAPLSSGLKAPIFLASFLSHE